MLDCEQTYFIKPTIEIANFKSFWVNKQTLVNTFKKFKQTTSCFKVEKIKTFKKFFW